jgi:Cdc6-like AAA superfamily ATPase
MSEIDDAKDWVESNKKYKEEKQNVKPLKGATPQKTESKEEDDKAPEQVCQYALYGRGYTATASTVESLPPGCYDIQADQRCTYVVPAAKPSGLLLELPEMRSKQVIQTIDSFWASEKDYKEGNEFVVGGAAYKAGIMIYGPPGTGKTCTIKIVSNKLIKRGGTVFYASAHPVNVMGFLADFSTVEKDRKSIVILEDFDSLISNFGEAGYLAMLDSAQSINNVLFIATTNYPERLDPRIYNRPGRFSHVVKIGYPSPSARAAYLKAILKNHKDVEYIVDNTSGFSIDHLTSLVNACYREKKKMGDEITRLRTLFNVPKSEERSLGFGIGSKEET